MGGASARPRTLAGGAADLPGAPARPVPAPPPRAPRLPGRAGLPGSVHPNRLRNPEALLGLLRGAGLGARDALYVHSDLATRMFAFTLLVDHPADRGTAGDADATGALPDGWAAAHPGLDLPRLTEAAGLPAPTPDELFEELARSVLADITARLERASEPG
ncbi:hypothetical protein ACFQVA_23990 [Actinomadura keratinilytica]